MAEKWQARGTYFEACNCQVACPCNFTSAPTEGECKVVVAWPAIPAGLADGR
jgi:hypothetical protein